MSLFVQGRCTWLSGVELSWWLQCFNLEIFFGRLQGWVLLISRKIKFQKKSAHYKCWLPWPAQCWFHKMWIRAEFHHSPALFPALFCHASFLVGSLTSEFLVNLNPELEVFHLKGFFYSLGFVCIKYCVVILSPHTKTVVCYVN